MGATTYRLMSGFAEQTAGEAGMAGLTAQPKLVFSSTLEGPTVLGQHRAGRR